MVKFFKSLMLEVTKEMKLNVAEYTLLLVLLKKSQIEEMFLIS